MLGSQQKQFKLSFFFYRTKFDVADPISGTGSSTHRLNGRKTMGMMSSCFLSTWVYSRATTDHCESSRCVLCIFCSYFSSVQVFYHHNHKSPLWASFLPPTRSLYFQQSSTNPCSSAHSPNHLSLTSLALFRTCSVCAALLMSYSSWSCSSSSQANLNIFYSASRAVFCLWLLFITTLIELWTNLTKYYQRKCHLKYE